MARREARRRQGGIVPWLAALGILMVIAGLAFPTDPGTPFAPAIEKSARPTGTGDALIVPSIKVNAPMEFIEVRPDGVLSAPDNTRHVGYWKRSAAPGARGGQTVVTGHSVHTGGGAMNPLGKVKAGDVVQIRFQKRLVEYRISYVTTFTKEQLASNARGLFGQKRETNRLVLITCTNWRNGDYQDNIIVYADPVRAVNQAA